jgi:hypothetical protein
LVHEDRPIAIVPIEGEETTLPRLQRGGLIGQLFLKGTIALADDFHPPLEDVAYR